MKSSINKTAIVCVLGIGENGLNTVRSLGRAGIPVTVVGIKGDLNLAKDSKYCSQFETIYSFDKKQLLDKLFQLRNKLTYNPILFFDNDYMLALLNDSEELLKTNFVLTQGIKDFSFKEFQMKSAIDAGIDVPKTWRPITWKEIKYLDVTTEQKFIAKPSQGIEKKPFKTIKAENITELLELLKKKVQSPQNIIIQEYIKGDQNDIWVVLGYKSDTQGFSHLLTATKYSMYPPDGGVMAIGKLIRNTRLNDISKRMINQMGYKGIFGLEFKYSIKDDKYYFIEMSPRTEGFHNITKLVGVDLPILAYNDLILNKEISHQHISNYQGYWVNIRYFIESLLFQKSLVDLKKIFIALFSKHNFQHLEYSDIKPFINANVWYLITWRKRIKKLFLRTINGK